MSVLASDTRFMYGTNAERVLVVPSFFSGFTVWNETDLTGATYLWNNVLSVWEQISTGAPVVPTAPVIAIENSGEALAIGAPVAFINSAGTATLMRSTADGTDPDAVRLRRARGIVLTVAGGAGVPTTFALAGKIHVPTATFIVAPVAADIGKDFYVSKTKGRLTIDVSTFLPTDTLVPMGGIEGVGADITLDVLPGFRQTLS